MGSTVLMLVLMGAAFYFLLIRPQQKRAKQQQEMTNSLQPGTRVMLSSGVFGTIRHLGERQAIIEIAPGIEMTVIKQAVVKTLKPEDDEFEYSDDDQVSDDAPAEPAFEAAEPSPFDNIQPSDFIDPKPSDVRTTDDDPTDQSSTKK